MIRLGMTYSSLTRLNYTNIEGHARTVKIKIGEEEKQYYVISESISSHAESAGWWEFHISNHTVYSYELEEIFKVHVKTKEQLAAEESVAKAKEALKAAENALKVVKEKK